MKYYNNTLKIKKMFEKENDKKNKNKTTASAQSEQGQPAADLREELTGQTKEEFAAQMEAEGKGEFVSNEEDEFEEVTGGSFLKADNMEIGVGEVYTFLKMDEYTDEKTNRTNPYALIEDQHKRQWKAAQTMIVEHLKEVETGRKVRITSLGKKKGAKYTYDNFKIEVAKK